MISVELTFGPGNNQRCVNVTVNDDDIVEATENFSAILTTLDPAVTLDPDTAQVEILADPDDGKKMHVLVVPYLYKILIYLLPMPNSSCNLLLQL